MRVPALRRAAASLAVAACVLPLAAAPAAADSQPEGSGPDAFLALIIQPLEGSGGDHRFLTLECGPDGGTHPYPEFACDALREVDGDFEALPPLYDPCPPVIWPTRGTAVGHWNGRGVYHSVVAGDACSLSNSTGGVFPG
ncbi:hypothetical protein NI17_012330 [Thermobifida halotolerans]|uniref:Subtilisin inhibitor domain-containing protein n=1 Tax=Thermobifida halotolerans TaxID=483545 RepID=A0AA97M1Q8_9ACTN|nr:SSI family serine proteinase inhibitor [Thermobifida halotolerans]UOE17699.1 hypothetical protein NI17_012330 [Thermobifida halotolerans]